MDKEKIQNREREVKQLEEEMKLLEKDLGLIIQMQDKIKEIHLRKKKLEHYYFEKGYREDRKIEEYFDNTYGLLSEDGLWNLFYEVEQEQLKILKFLVHNLS